MDLKQCNKCHEHLPLASYSRSKTMKDGYQYTCRDCAKIYQKELRRNPKNRERARQYAANKRRIAKLAPRWQNCTLDGVILQYQNGGKLFISTPSLRLALDNAGYDYIPLRLEHEPEFISKDKILMTRPKTEEEVLAETEEYLANYDDDDEFAGMNGLN